MAGAAVVAAGAGAAVVAAGAGAAVVAAGAGAAVVAAGAGAAVGAVSSSPQAIATRARTEPKIISLFIIQLSFRTFRAFYLDCETGLINSRRAV